MPTRIKAVLIDAGGTLFHLRASVGEVYAEVAGCFGASLDPVALDHEYRAAAARMPPLSFGNVAPSALLSLERRWWARLVEQVIARTSVSDFDAMFEEIFGYFASGAAWQLFPDALETLDALRREGLAIAIVSNFDARLFSVCDDLGLSRRAQAVIASSRIGYAKPDRRIFHLTLRRLGVTGAEALHVGDTVRDDYEGARAAGLSALWLDRGHSGQGDPTATIASLLEVVDRLG